MDFVAIDFETATSSSTSMCSMGICVVENNKVVSTEEILVRPTPFEFNEYNIKIHGITPKMVADMPTFDMYWEQVAPYIQNKLIVAHNASFDVGVLRATLDVYKIPYPVFDYICTVKLSQKAYPSLTSHKLNNLCDALGISFSHHHAADDAYACACVLLNILSDFNIDSLEGLENQFNVNVGHIYPGYRTPCKKTKKRVKHHEKIYSANY